MNFKAMRFESTSFNRIVADKSLCVYLSDRFFCIHSGSLCEFQSDRFESTSFSRIVADKSHCVTLFTKLWQSCSDPHLKIRPIAIFAFYSLNYSLAAGLQDNSRPKSTTKVETKRKLQQFTFSGWLIMNGGGGGNEKKKTLRLKLHSI